MHHRLCVTTDIKNAKNSEEARLYVARELFARGFSNSGDYESPTTDRWDALPGFSDWFVVGGRWSGAITRALFPKKKYDAFYKKVDKLSGMDSKKRKIQIAKIFKKTFPNFKGTIPFCRDTYQSEGYEDDAQIITKSIYKELLKPYKGQVVEEYFIDLEGEKCSEKMINQKWICVVDYHS